MSKSQRNHYAIPFYLRSEGEKLQDHFIETDVGLIQADMMSRIDRKHLDGDLKYKEAAAELRRTADYIDSIAPISVPVPAPKRKVKVSVSAMDTSSVVAALDKVKQEVAQAVKQETKYVDPFDSTFLEYLISGNPFVLSPNGRFTADQRKKFKSYCFVEIEEIRNGVFLKSKKMSNGKEHPITLISPTVDIRQVGPGPAVALDNGDRVIIGLVNIDAARALDLSRTFNGFYRD